MDLTEKLRKRLETVQFEYQPENTGEVVEVGDGAAKIRGLSQVAVMEMLKFEKGQTGLALNLSEDLIGSIILGDHTEIKAGDKVTAGRKLLSVPVGEKLLGRVINPLGDPLDNGGKIEIDNYYPIEKIAPGVIYRQPVDTPVQTGIKIIDAVIPIGRGQRQLIIGDRKTGKTAIALDTILNQKDQNMICIYVSIGQKTSSTALIIDILKKYKAIDYTIVIAADAKDPAAIQYIAPYSGCAIGEYFMDKGKDVLIVYDDLTKHAWAYREISLILRRPSGREAYPGDVFYLHSRLLERAVRMGDKYGGGSLTALPIIETQAGDISAYIPTNVISITDGQIILDTDLFNAGIRPAVNAGSSVSRVGGAAQTKAMKQVAGKLRLELAQYRELSAFVQFASELDEKTRKQIDKGARMTQILKQKQYNPKALPIQIAVIWAATKGYLDDIDVDKVSEFEEKFSIYLEDMHKEVLDKIEKEKILTDEIETRLKQITEEFKKTQVNR